jgi:ParB/RepB/Spo0J family partition protein
MATADQATIPVAATPTPAVEGRKLRLKEIPLRQIRESKVALRDVDKEDEKYLGLVDSIRDHGVMNAIVVREIGKEDGEMVYGLIDGLQRFTASGDAGKPTIPAQILDLSDAQILEAQIIANVHKIETKKFQYAKQLEKILAENPFMTMNELAGRLNKSAQWLSDQLNLSKLPNEVGTLVDEGKIGLSNAYVLSKLPVEEMANFIERAMTQQPGEFAPQVNSRMKEIREARRQGREAQGETFNGVPYLQKMAPIKAELDQPTAIKHLLETQQPKTPIEAAKLTLAWVLMIDPITLTERQRKYEEKRSQDKAEKEKRDKEKLARKSVEAQKVAAQLREKADAAGLDLEAERVRIEREDAERAAAAASGEGQTEPFEKEPVPAQA